MFFFFYQQSFKALRSYNLPSPDYEDEIEMQFSRNIPSPIYTEEQMKESNYWSRFIPSPDHHYSKRGKNYQPRVRDFWSSSDYKPRYARYSVDNQTTRNFGPSPMRKTNEDKSIVVIKVNVFLNSCFVYPNMYTNTVIANSHLFATILNSK